MDSTNKIKHSAFFGEKGLTSTSANHIANLAKEYIQSAEMYLNNVVFYDIDMSLIGSDTKRLRTGSDSEVLQSIQVTILNIAKAKSLIAWLREAIKAKQKLIKDLENIKREDWAAKFNIILPEQPIYKAPLTEEEYYDSLDIKERNRYYELETEAAVIGKYIHPDGTFACQRQKLKDVMYNPNKVEGSGRDAIIYSYTPTVSINQIDETFFELQKIHREKQAQLNAIKHNCEVAINESVIKCNSEYTTALAEYQNEMDIISSRFKEWVQEEYQKYSKLKIVIPNSLVDIYNEINSLGK